MSQEEVRSPQSKQGAGKGNGAMRTSADELLEKMANEAAEPVRPKSSMARALRDVLIVALLLAGGTFLYYRHVKVKEQVTVLALAAQDLAEKDDLKSLRGAEAKYQEILALDADNPTGLSGIAEIYFHQSRHGLDTKGKAEEYLKRATSEGSKSPSRYATQAYLDISAGRADQVAKEMQELIDQGAGDSKILHALGWALLEQGKYNEANRVVDAALQSSFKSVRYALTLAEIGHRRGGPDNAGDRAAVRNLTKILGNAMNPDHELALTELAALRAKNYGNLDKSAKWMLQVNEKKDALGPVAQAQLAWATGEFVLARGDAKSAFERADEAIKIRPSYPPFYSLKARALVAQNKLKDAYAAYEESFAKGPLYRGMKWEYAELKSKNGDDGALAIIAELEKSDPGTTVGAEYEIFRGEHYLRKNDIPNAKKAFTKAADMGDDAEILFGLAKVTFLEEKSRGNKANLERVAETFGQASDARATFPELQEYMGGISLWNFLVDGAQGSFEEAEKQYKKLNRPVPEILAFYDRVIAAYEGADKSIKKDTDKLVPDWKKRKDEYLASVEQLLQ